MFRSVKIVTVLCPLIIVGASAQRCICEPPCTNTYLSKNCSILTNVNISNFQLTAANFKDVENDTTINLIELRLRHIETIEANAFQHLNVNNVILEYNNIYEIGSDSFSGVSKLTNLHLEHNSIETLEPNSIPATENLYLDYNFIKTLDGSMFASISTISIFSITNNRIAVIGSNTFNNSRLTHLYLSFNRLAKITVDFFVGMEGVLEEIYLDANNIKTIEEKSIPAAKRVKLHHNSLTSLNSRNFKNVGVLTFLNVHYNCLDNVNMTEFTRGTIIKYKYKLDQCSLAKIYANFSSMQMMSLILGIIAILLVINIFIFFLRAVCVKKAHSELTNRGQFSVHLPNKSNIKNGRTANNRYSALYEEIALSRDRILQSEVDDYEYVMPVEWAESPYQRVG